MKLPVGRSLLRDLPSSLYIRCPFDNREGATRRHDDTWRIFASPLLLILWEWRRPVVVCRISTVSVLSSQYSTADSKIREFSQFLFLLMKSLLLVVVSSLRMGSCYYVITSFLPSSFWKSGACQSFFPLL